MTLTKNFMYQGPAAPGDTVVPANLNTNHRIRRINATADVASKMCAGILVYGTFTTNAADMTQAAATIGRDSLNGILCVVEIQHHNPAFPTTTTTPRFPNKIPNASSTLTNYTAGANENIIIIPLEKGMYVWLLQTVNATGATTINNQYYLTTDGFVAAPGDPDGVAIDESGHCFTAIATTATQNWALYRYEGQVAHDKTA